MEKENSEFGKGLVICLVKFAEHAMQLQKWLETMKSLGEKESVELWANGASDHLYEIEVPKGKDWSLIRRKVKELQSKGLEMGHGFTQKTFIKKDAFELMELTREIALMIDKKLGLKPQIGEW